MIDYLGGGLMLSACQQAASAAFMPAFQHTPPLLQLCYEACQLHCEAFQLCCEAPTALRGTLTALQGTNCAARHSNFVL